MTAFRFTHADLVAALDYNPITGKFLWRKYGCEAGSVNSLGYRIIGFRGRKYQAHRLAWFIITQHWPLFHIDHVNGIRDDNSAKNLRQVTCVGNAQNSMKAWGKIPYRGVTEEVTANGRRYRAHIYRDGCKLNLGAYPTPEEAYEAYKVAKAKLHTATQL